MEGRAPQQPAQACGTCTFGSANAQRGRPMVSLLDFKVDWPRCTSNKVGPHSGRVDDKGELGRGSQAKCAASAQEQGTQVHAALAKRWNLHAPC